MSTRSGVLVTLRRPAGAATTDAGQLTVQVRVDWTPNVDAADLDLAIAQAYEAAALLAERHRHAPAGTANPSVLLT